MTAAGSPSAGRGWSRVVRPARCTVPASRRWTISCSTSASNVWGVTDMSTGLHNGFTDGLPNNPTTIDHTATGDVSTFIGVFGNNWLFFVPTSGLNAGEVLPVRLRADALRDDRPDLRRQHAHHLGAAPGRGLRLPARAPHAHPRHRDARPRRHAFTQNRTVPRSSNWPSNIEGCSTARRGPV